MQIIENDERSNISLPYTTPKLWIYGALGELTKAGTGGGKTVDSTFTNKTH